jgi:hypothetical protein
MKSEILMTGNIKAMVFRDVTLYSLVHWYQMAWRSLLSIMEVRTAGLSETVPGYTASHSRGL